MSRAARWRGSWDRDRKHWAAGQYPPARAYIYQEFPKWVHGQNHSVIVQNAEEERRIRSEYARDIGRDKANTLQRLRADTLARELAPEVVAFRARGFSFRGIADALNARGIRSARGHDWGPAQVYRLLRRAENAVATGAAPGRSELTTRR